jgi:hypothetical protein
MRSSTDRFVSQLESPFLEAEILPRDPERGAVSTHRSPTPEPGEVDLLEGESVDTGLMGEQILVDPAYISDDGEKAADIWKHSDKLRILLRRKGDPDERDREELATAVTRQLATVVLHWKAVQFLADSKNIGALTAMTLYVLLFPGEAKDNTGIKDLNDKVLGYQLNHRFITLRQREIAAIFWPKDDQTFIVVGQDYKTASVLTLSAKREQFAERLARLDGRLRQILLDDILPAAEKEAERRKQKERLAEIRKLRKTLAANAKYKFEIFFGLASQRPKSLATVLETVYLLETEARKGAGLSRVVAKALSLETRYARQRFTKDMKFDGRSVDPRGKQFEPKAYLTTTTKAGDIKGLMMRAPSRDHPEDLRSLYVASVWTTSFLKHRRWFVGHPDVIRDVRRKALERPETSKGNVKYWYPAQKDLLELWLVLINMLDYVKDFLSKEVLQDLARYHRDALGAFTQLIRRSKVPIEWARLENVLTQDVRQRRIAVLGTASEFQFYSLAADYSERIFFSMDIRDFGVAVALLYENATEEIEFRKHTGVKLMEETFKSTDEINEQRRFAYDRVVQVFKSQYDRIRRTQPGNVAADTKKAFGTEIRTRALGEFHPSIQIMLGGDEIFVAAHPWYAGVEHVIVGELANTSSNGRTLNIRTAVAFSRAAGDSPAREAVQDSHHRAMTLADLAPSTLKRLERTRRRIERLIEKLENNPKKRPSAPDFQEQLEKLRLDKLFARVVHGKATSLTPERFSRLFTLLRAGDLRGAEKTGDFELVDFDGHVVNGEALEKDAARLEEAVRKKVGSDNTHVDPPPVTKIPKWIEALLDKLLPRDGGK